MMEGLELLIPKAPEIWVSLASFLVLFFALAKFAFPAISKMLDERAAKIRESLERAEETRVEAEALLEDYKVQMAEARNESAKVIEQGRKVAEAMREEMIVRARQEADAIVVQAREDIEGEKKAAMADLRSEIAELSVAVAGKLLGEKLSAAEHNALIERYVSEVGGLNEG